MALWHGLGVVAADAFVFMPDITRAYHQTRLAAQPDQRLFGLYLRGPRLCPYAQFYGPETGECQMLFESQHHLQANDVLGLYGRLVDRPFVTTKHPVLHALRQ